MKSKKIKTTFARKVFVFFNTLFLVALSLVALYPITYVLFASLSDAPALIQFRGILWHPLGFDIQSYKHALTHPLIVSGYLNTIFVVVVGVIVNVILTAMGAYFLSRENVMFQKPISIMIIFTMFVSGGTIPFYFTIRDLGLYDSIWALILPTAISTFNLMVMRSGFLSIPSSLEESAKIDGAGHMTILFRIVLPLALPTVAVMVLYYGVSHWNSWFNASIFIQDEKKQPLQLVVRQILIVNDTSSMGAESVMDTANSLAISETIKYAVIIITTLPILCLYPFLQKYFVKGIMVGAVKG